MFDLQNILKEHAEWIASDGKAGKRANLSDADLSHANLSDADLHYADLSGADLSHANLSAADLSHANLSAADLSDADLSHANLSVADLSVADLSGANLIRAALRGANLRDADLSGAVCVADLRGANLSNANLRYADLSGTILDFSCWPLWCGSIGAIADDRLVAQLLFHVTRLDVSKCSGGVQEAMDYIRRMAVSDLFCEYRTDVKPLDN